jgi:ArsR family metal-binding transcriptional regulator
MLIESYRTEIAISTHSVQHFDYEAVAHLEVDIGPVIPYLNGLLEGGVYVPDVPALAWRYEGHKVGFWPDRIAADELASREEAGAMIRRLVDLVNQTWERRAELTPDASVHERRQPLELFKLLPRTNCGACGEATCFNFALKLAAGQVELRACTPLHEAGREGARQSLEEMLAAKWPTV